eukprot:3946187-Alexandrium_andersonii.AAC.1
MEGAPQWAMQLLSEMKVSGEVSNLKAVQEQQQSDMKELSTRVDGLVSRLERVESASAGLEPAAIGSAAKRARSAPHAAQEPRGSGDTSRKPCVVLCGFPKATKKKEIEEWAEQQLQHRSEWRDLKAFAPNVRGTIGLIRMETKQDVLSFIDAWK